MFKPINDRINVRFESEIPNGKVEIIECLRGEATRKRPFSSLLSDHVDFSAFKFLDDTIEVLEYPAFLQPLGRLVKSE